MQKLSSLALYGNVYKLWKAQSLPSPAVGREIRLQLQHSSEPGRLVQSNHLPTSGLCQSSLCTSGSSCPEKCPIAVYLARLPPPVSDYQVEHFLPPSQVRFFIPYRNPCTLLLQNTLYAVEAWSQKIRRWDQCRTAADSPVMNKGLQLKNPGLHMCTSNRASNPQYQILQIISYTARKSPSSWHMTWRSGVSKVSSTGTYLPVAGQPFSDLHDLSRHPPCLPVLQDISDIPRQVAIQGASGHLQRRVHVSARMRRLQDPQVVLERVDEVRQIQGCGCTRGEGLATTMPSLRPT